jgi:hypothetical protein
VILAKESSHQKRHWQALQIAVITASDRHSGLHGRTTPLTEHSIHLWRPRGKFRRCVLFVPNARTTTRARVSSAHLPLAG